MAIMASAARDIPQTSPTRDNLTVVADHRDASVTVARPLDLPTPPNSISPGLPAHGLKAQLRKAQLEPVDSDLDLHDASEDARNRSVSPSDEASGCITPGLLAKHYLPDILLSHGPLAIRHIMGYLTTTVPGFVTVPPTKARRLVVSALEGRGGEAARMEQDDVEFNKVGWGRWDARRRGGAARASDAASRQSQDRGQGPAGIPIGDGAGRAGALGRLRVHVASPPADGDSFHFSHDGRDVHMMTDNDDVDNMSMDGSAEASCSEAPDDDVMNDDPEDNTDDEDWAAMGAAALRADSYPTNAAAAAAAGQMGMSRFAGSRSFSGVARGAPQLGSIDLAALAGTSDAQEREAIEALMCLGSV
ncbi:putative Sin3 binding protein [Geosmithia morbida]|uniref:Sin3 binding protein n=1 Tax=Geosmithia morbida TaxID=1094350 RepID=A0A9P4YQB6_9HYPO|nr:putative Sin3 binding protein [Geosmithia morbida]KAF4121176.1 putative Sin3 binding protein [Geosmithia morbida]